MIVARFDATADVPGCRRADTLISARLPDAIGHSRLPLRQTAF